MFSFKCKKLIALAFVPSGDVTTAPELYANQFDEDADALIDYFEKTWIGEPKRRGIFLFLVLNNFQCTQKFLGADQRSLNLITSYRTVMIVLSVVYLDRTTV